MNGAYEIVQIGKTMKAYLVWLKTELKRVAKRLPSLFIGAIVLALLAGAIAFCAFMYAQINGQRQQVEAKVAFVAPEDGLTDLAIRFVTGMESVKDWCSFERYTLEDGLNALESGTVVALIVLPEEVIQSILDGTNTPAQLYLPKEQDLGGTLLEIMAKAGISLLQVAQGEIYATTDLYYKYPLKESLSSLYSDINLYNINIALNREELFKTILLTETEGVSFVEYYGASAISIFALFFGLLYGDLILECSDRDKLLHKSRVSIAAQTIGRWMVLTFISFVCIFVVVLSMCCYLAGRDELGQSFILCLKHTPLLLLTVACLTALYMLIGTLLKDRMAYLFGLGLGIVIFGYIGGYFVPSGLLGTQMKSVASVFPTTYLHRISSSILAGDKTSSSYIVLLVWLICSLLLTYLLKKRRCLR